MRPSTRSLQAFCSVLKTSIISATSATDTQRSNIALQTPLHDSYPEFLTSKSQPWTRRRARKKTTTGRTQIRPRRTVSAVAVDVTLILLMWKGKKVLVLQSGWRLPEAGHRHKPTGCCLLLFCILFGRALWAAPSFCFSFVRRDGVHDASWAPGSRYRSIGVAG
ncbi:hypothetical protein B5807_03286 [Epicoccum nigrum]|jgi:hypothetical protein|uniref:Uncharacterized protein n=1 Tax=Epicoccum nigrum TaxID=105696 RepID=A0A1Y2M7T9_EPING|nr:hypothetical protein B5807_03286 [Epicoccum nigrum]